MTLYGDTGPDWGRGWLRVNNIAVCGRVRHLVRLHPWSGEDEGDPTLVALCGSVSIGKASEWRSIDVPKCKRCLWLMGRHATASRPGVTL